MWSLCMWHPWLQRTGTLAQIASQLAETTRPLTKVVWKLGGSEEVLRMCAIYCLVPKNDAFHLKWLKLGVFCLICVSYHPRSSLSMQNSMEIHGMSLAEVCMWSFWSGNFPVKWWSACEAQLRFDDTRVGSVDRLFGLRQRYWDWEIIADPHWHICIFELAWFTQQPQHVHSHWIGDPPPLPMGQGKRSEIMNWRALTLSFSLSASISVKVIFREMPVKACGLG